MAISILLLMSCLPGISRAAPPLDDWRNEITSVRKLAENDAALAYKKALRLESSLPANAMPADKAKVLNLLARTELYTAQTAAAANHAQQALNLAKQYSDRVGQAEAYLNMSLNAVNQGKIDVIVDASPRALEVLQGIDNPALLSEAMMRLAMMYLRLGQLDATVTLCMQTMDVAKRSNDPLALLYAHQGLGIAFNNNGRYAEAHEHFTQMRDLARALKLGQPEGEAISGMAFTQSKFGDWRTAALMHRESIAIFRSVGVPFNTAHALYSLADTLRQHGQLTESLKTLSETIAIYQRYPNKIGLWWALIARSENYLALKNLAAAQADAEQAYAQAQKMNLLLYRAESAKRMATIAAASGEHKRAYQFATEAADLTDQMTREKSSARMVELAQRYQSESKQRKIDELTRNEQQREHEQRWLWTILGGSIILLAGSGYFLLRLRRSHRLLQTANAQLQLSQDETRALNIELEQRVQASTAELRQQSRYLRTLFDTLPISVWLKDTTGRYLTINTSHVAVKGLTAEKMIGKTDEELWPGDIGTAFRAADIEVMETRHRKTQELAIPGENGTIFWREIDKAPVIDEDGTVIGTVGVGRDISERKRYEQSLLAQAKLEQRLSALTSNIPGFVYTLRLEPDGHSSFPFASAGVEEIFGLPPAEIRDDANVLRAHYHPEDLTRMFYEMEESERTLKPFHAEIRIRDRNNEERWVEVRSIPQRQPDGCTEWHGIMLDITERKRMEETLAARERELRALAESSPGMMGSYYLRPDGKVCMPYVSANIQELFGLTPQDVADDATALTALNHPDDVKKVQDSIAESARTMTPWRLEYRILHPAKGLRWMEGHTNPLPHPDGGIVWYGYVHDITWRKQIEAALQDSEARYRQNYNLLQSMLESSSSVSVYALDREYRLLAFNRKFREAAKRLWGADIAVGMNILEVIDTDAHREFFRQGADRVLEGHSYSLDSKEAVLKDGVTVYEYHENYGAPIYSDNGEVSGLTVFAITVTERKEAEQKLKEALEFNEGVISAIPDLLFEVDRNGKYLNVWTHTPELLAAQKETLLNNTVHDVLPAESAAMVMQSLREADERGVSFGNVIQINLPQGINWFELSVSKKPGSSSADATFLVLSRDITARKKIETALSESEARLRTLIDNLPFEFWAMDSNLCYTMQNTASLKSYGNVVGKRIEDLGLPPEIAAQWIAQDKKVLAGEILHDEYEKEVNGEKRVFDSLAAPVFLDDVVVGIVGVGIDITERKQMEAALNESEARYRNNYNLLKGMLESTTEITFFALDLEYRYLAFNAAHRRDAKSLWGTDIELGKNWLDGLHTANTEEHREFCRKGFDRVLAGESYAIESTENAIGKDGQVEPQYFDNFGTPIRNEAGEIIGLTIFSVNITERKKLEAELRASRNFLDSVIDSVSDPIFVKDRQHRWTLLNDAFCTFIGKPREELVGKSDYDFFPEEEADVFWAKDELVFTSRESNLNEENFTSADGGEHFIQTRKTPFTSGDGREMLVGIIRDITELKRYEAAREAALAEAVRLAKSRSEFLAHMSHELRTPLNGILGYTQILQRNNALGERNADALNVIRQSGEHLLALVEDILDLARIEAGRFKLDLSDIALATFLRVVTDIIRVRAKEKNIEFICDFSRDLPAGIRGDDKRLRQVLLNLLSNAVKFTERGTVTLHVGRVSPSHLAFRVDDTGRGIPANELETIFQPFEQSGDTQQRFGGSGLGLSISRKLVRLMGGNITVESKEGKGSSFRFELELPEVQIVPVALLPEPVVRDRPQTDSGQTFAEPLVLPPVEELQTLHHLAQLGNMRDISQYAERIAGIAPRYQSFSEHLHRMAEGYQSKAILAFVEEHLNDTKKSSPDHPDR